MWRSKTGKSGASSLELCSIPPTTEAFTENVHRCHLQVAIWKAALLESPEMDSTKYGWELDHIIIIMAGMAVFYVAGYLIEERRRWPVITASPRGQCSK